ncbi:MAG: sensor histidine kinase [Saprospiraceae bacterium]|nr:sensor histidine kinase [Saprospiraceae bacterium]
MSKLSKLSSALALLAKIENQEFVAQQTIDFSEVVAHNVALFSEIAELKDLSIEADIAPAIQLNMDSALADILVANLLKNAIQHNVDEGWIKISLTPHQLLLENTGKPLTTTPETLFVRFRKNNQSSASLGLGLAIVKKIADLNGLTIDYQQEANIHRITISL